MRDIVRKLENTNPAGVMLIQWAPVEAVRQWTTKSRGKYTAEIQFFEGWRWFDLYGIPETLFFREPKKRAAAGPYYETTAGCVVPGDDEEFRDVFEWAEDRRFIVRTKDHVGAWRLVATPWHGLKMETDFDTDRIMAGQRGFTVSFEGRTPSASGIYAF
jgi:hypothetical protein